MEYEETADKVELTQFEALLRPKKAALLRAREHMENSSMTYTPQDSAGDHSSLAYDTWLVKPAARPCGTRTD